MKQAFLRAAAAALLIGTLPTAHAVPTATLRFIIDGGAPIDCLDNAACDASGADGVVVFNDTLGVFEINVTTGLSRPAIINGDPLIDLNSVNVNVLDSMNNPVAPTDAHTLVIMFSDKDFSLAGEFSGGFGGTLNSGSGASIVATAYYDAGNDLFDTTTLMGSIGPFGPGPFSGSFTDGFTPDAPYS